MDEELIDLAGAFDDNPADLTQGEREATTSKPVKPATPVATEEVVTEEIDPEEEELDENGDAVVDPEGEEEPELELVEGEEGEEAVDLKDDVKLILTVNGKQVEKTLGQLRADAQKYEASEERFQEATTIRKDAEAKLAVLPQMEQQLKSVLEFYIGQSQQFVQAQQPDWVKLLDENPTEYVKQRHAWEIKQGELVTARNIQLELQRRTAEAEQASRTQTIGNEKIKLLAAIPEWQDPVKAAEGSKAVGDYLAKSGIPDDLLKNIDHHQVLVIARKAMLYDQAIAKQQAARKPGAKTNQVPKQNVRVERPGAATSLPSSQTRSQASRQKAEQRFKQAPSVDNLATLFE